MKLDQPWAKTAPNGETCSLIAHCHHVAVMARHLMSSSVLRQRLAVAFDNDLTERHLDRLAILAGIHDLGKALKGFQDKLEGTLLTSRGHVAEALALPLSTSICSPAKPKRPIWPLKQLFGTNGQGAGNGPGESVEAFAEQHRRAPWQRSKATTPHYRKFRDFSFSVSMCRSGT
jgi:hypothetical protein